MPEFYDHGSCNYQPAAQPYLAAIARGVRNDSAVRTFLLKGTQYAEAYANAEPLWLEQWEKRDPFDSMKCPFWSNYFCGLDSRCTCRIPGSKGLESDAIFFFRNSFKRVLAVHVEFKHSREPFRFGQPEAYPLRAACFSKTYRQRSRLNAHDDWTTVLFCGTETLSDKRLRNFQRVITHSDAMAMIPSYPRN